MNVIVSLDYNPHSLEEARIQAICEFALRASGAPDSSEVFLSFVDNDEMALLNEKYRGKVGPTDVLSFECDNLDDDFPTEGVLEDHILGDIVIAQDVAYKQAVEYETSFEDEIDLLCVHGILHLQGYDHIKDDEAEEMESLQKEILNKWKAEVNKNA